MTINVHLKSTLYKMNKYLWIQAWCQVHVYLYLSTFKYTPDSICTLLKYFLIPAGVFVLILKVTGYPLIKFVGAKL